jgi:hypothetical protein
MTRPFIHAPDSHPSETLATGALELSMGAC